MTLVLEDVTGADVASLIPDLARLRISVFRDWPYLYDGDAEYEASYLAAYTDPGAIVVTARTDGGALVGAATGLPLSGHDAALVEAVAGSGRDPSKIFYCAESVLLPDWRGQGAGHGFFDRREAFARKSGFSQVAFCAVIRPEDHPSRPPGYRPLDGFWRARGYAPLPGVVARLGWRDIGAGVETEKPLQFWIRELP